MNLVVIMQKAFKHLIDPRAKDNSCSSHQKKKRTLRKSLMPCYTHAMEQVTNPKAPHRQIPAYTTSRRDHPCNLSKTCMSQRETSGRLILGVRYHETPSWSLQG
jgi:hypothetical protein